MKDKGHIDCVILLSRCTDGRNVNVCVIDSVSVVISIRRNDTLLYVSRRFAALYSVRIIQSRVTCEFQCDKVEKKSDECLSKFYRGRLRSREKSSIVSVESLHRLRISKINSICSISIVRQ